MPNRVALRGRYPLTRHAYEKVHWIYVDGMGTKSLDPPCTRVGEVGESGEQLPCAPCAALPRHPTMCTWMREERNADSSTPHFKLGFLKLHQQQQQQQQQQQKASEKETCCQEGPETIRAFPRWEGQEAVGNAGRQLTRNVKRLETITLGKRHPLGWGWAIPPGAYPNRNAKRLETFTPRGPGTPGGRGRRWHTNPNQRRT